MSITTALRKVHMSVCLAIRFTFHLRYAPLLHSLALPYSDGTLCKWLVYSYVRLLFVVTLLQFFSET
jgi:hypothetical protein